MGRGNNRLKRVHAHQIAGQPRTRSVSAQAAWNRTSAGPMGGSAKAQQRRKRREKEYQDPHNW